MPLNPFGRATKLQVLARGRLRTFGQVNDFGPNLRAPDLPRRFQRAFVEEVVLHRIYVQDIEHTGSIEPLLETDMRVEIIVRFECNEILSEGPVLRPLDYFILQF
jgi:hypothetical protein